MNVLRDDVAAIARQALRLDDDDLAFGELRQHAVAEHHQGEGLGGFAGLQRGIRRRGGHDGNDLALHGRNDMRSRRPGRTR